jgi:hypothetical protein
MKSRIENNRYFKGYLNIIRYAKSFNRTKNNGYYEKHHIIPGSLGGKDSDSNFVLLTAEEHFTVHALLPKFLTGEDKRKMLYAFNGMCYRISDNQKRIKINAKMYKDLREEFSKMRSLAMSGDQNPLYGKTHSEESRKKISESLKGKFKGDQNHFYGKTHSEETRKKISESKRGEKSSSAKTIYIYDNNDEVQFICKGDFKKVCEDNNLPVRTLERSYLNEGKPIYQSRQPKNKDFLKFKGWYAKIIDKI